MGGRQGDKLVAAGVKGRIGGCRPPFAWACCRRCLNATWAA